MMRILKNVYSTDVVLNVAGIIDSDLRHAATISVRQHLVRAVTATHSNSFCQDLLQFRSSTARYQRPYQRQRIVVEVGLNTTSMSPSYLPVCLLAQSPVLLHLYLHLFVHKQLDIRYSRTRDNRTGHTRHVSALIACLGHLAGLYFANSKLDL